MKEHVLWHLEIDPPKPIQQHARIRYRTSGSGWVVLRDLGPEDRGEGSSSGKRASQADSELERFRLAGKSRCLSDQLIADSGLTDRYAAFSVGLTGWQCHYDHHDFWRNGLAADQLLPGPARPT